MSFKSRMFINREIPRQQQVVRQQTFKHSAACRLSEVHGCESVWTQNGACTETNGISLTVLAKSRFDRTTVVHVEVVQLNGGIQAFFLCSLFWPDFFGNRPCVELRKKQQNPSTGVCRISISASGLPKCWLGFLCSIAEKPQTIRIRNYSSSSLLFVVRH